MTEPIQPMPGSLALEKKVPAKKTKNEKRKIRPCFSPPAFRPLAMVAAAASAPPPHGFTKYFALFWGFTPRLPRGFGKRLG